MDPSVATTKLSEDRESHTTPHPFSVAIQSIIDDDASSTNQGFNNCSNHRKHGYEYDGSNFSGGFRFDFHLGSMTNFSNGTHDATHSDFCHEGDDDFAVGFDSSHDGSGIQQESRGRDNQQESRGREDGSRSKKKNK